MIFKMPEVPEAPNVPIEGEATGFNGAALIVHYTVNVSGLLPTRLAGGLCSYAIPQESRELYQCG